MSLHQIVDVVPSSVVSIDWRTVACDIRYQSFDELVNKLSCIGSTLSWPLIVVTADVLIIDSHRRCRRYAPGRMTNCLLNWYGGMVALSALSGSLIMINDFLFHLRCLGYYCPLLQQRLHDQRLHCRASRGGSLF